MHIYWRVMEELKYLGEMLVFHDPGLIREYRRWIAKNAGALGRGQPGLLKSPSGYVGRLYFPYSSN